MKKCGSCFRYCENWRDAEAKGLKDICYHGFGEYHRKPRPGVKPHAIGVNCPDDDEIRPDYPACRWHEYRWVYNFKTWWNWHFKQSIRESYRKYIRVPIGSLRKPVQLQWQSYYDGMADRIIPNGEPVCPCCGEMPYSYEQCVFCGQRFLPDENTPCQTEESLSVQDDGQPTIFIDGICPECRRSCGNGGHGPLRCSCGWVGKTVFSEEMQKAIDEFFAEDDKALQENESEGLQ